MVPSVAAGGRQSVQNPAGAGAGPGPGAGAPPAAFGGASAAFAASTAAFAAVLAISGAIILASSIAALEADVAAELAIAVAAPFVPLVVAATASLISFCALADAWWANWVTCPTAATTSS